MYTITKKIWAYPFELLHHWEELAQMVSNISVVYVTMYAGI